jgi:hypothetical protein
LRPDHHIIYHAWDAPSWNLDSNASDPRLLIPLEAVAGIVEVKSTLTNGTLNDAIKKICEIDEIVRSTEIEDGPFIFIFSYKKDKDDNFDEWGSPIVRLCSYAAPKCQPDGVFILDTGYSILASETGLARSYAIQNREDLDTALMKNEAFRDDFLQRFIELDASYCNDYKTWDGKDGAVILPFLTFVIQFCAYHSPTPVDYADIFSKWGTKKSKGKVVGERVASRRSKTMM